MEETKYIIWLVLTQNAETYVEDEETLEESFGDFINLINRSNSF